MNNADSKFDEGVKLLKEGLFKEALQIFNDLINSFPDNASYYSERGVVYFHMKSKQKALSDMDKAVELEPKKSYRYSSRAYIRGHFGMIHDAIKDYEYAVELDPEDAVAYNNLGLLQEQIGYQKMANDQFNKADKLADIQNQRGKTDLGIKGEAIEIKNVQEEIDAERENQSLWMEIKKLGTQKGRRSFYNFLKSGFKVKD